jgi:hypothetical protein
VRRVAAALGVPFIGPGSKPRGRAAFNGSVQWHQFQSLKGEERGVTRSAD